MSSPYWEDSYGLVRWLGYLTANELTLLKELARNLPPDPLVVNIGAGHGTATLGVLEERPDVLIFSIDTTAGEDPINTGEHLRLQEAGVAHDGTVIRVWGASQVVGKRWRFPADLVIVDGDHSPDGVVGDITTWLPHVKPGGIMLLHDYGKSVWPAVKEAVDAAFPGQEPLAYVDTYIAFRVGAAVTEAKKTLRGGYCRCGGESWDVPSC